MLRRARTMFARGLAVVVVGLFTSPARADPSIPPTLQAAIVAKMLAYDRALKARVGSSVDVGIVFKESDKASAEAAERLLAAFGAMSSRPVQGLPLRASRHAYKDADRLAQWLKAGGMDVVCVVTGLMKERDAIRNVAVDAKAVTVGGDRSQVEGGLAVAVVREGTAPRIIINIAAARAVGMDLDPKLLELAEVIG